LDNHTRYVQQFEEAEESANKGGRQEAEKARDYVDGKQFTAAEEAALRKRKQPITPENLIRPKIEALCGLERQGRVDPKAYPRVQSKEADADAATDALRYVEEDQDLDIKKSKVFENMLVEGFGGIEVTVRKLKSGAIDPYVIRISHDRLYRDPHAAEADFSDASFMGYITWMDFDAAKLKWPNKVDVLEATANRGTSPSFDAKEDKPRWASWYDSKRKRVRINTHYHLEGGVWHRCVFTLAGELEESAPSVFIDEEDKPENPLILQAAYIDRDNDAYGIVRDMIPLQDEVNKRRSKFLHLVNNSKLRVSPSVGQDKELIRREYAKPDAVIIGEQGEVEELGNIAKENGQFELLQDTRATLKGNVGPNAYLAGKAGDNQSGRAVLAQQQAGMTEVTPLLDNLRHFTLRMYRQIWNRVRQYWNEERWIRVTDDETNVRFVGLNTQPKIAPQEAQMAMMQVQQLVQSQQLDPETAQQYAQQIQQMAQVGNHIAELDVDIDIEEVNETPTLQAEQFDALMQLVGTGVFGQPVPPEIAELIVAASNFREKQKLFDIVEKMKEAAAQPNPVQQAAQQIQLQGAQAQVEETQSKTALNHAKAQQAATPAEPQSVDPIDAARLHLDGQQTQIDGYRAATERMEALRPEPPKQNAA
jgi:hypothetical protein